MKMKHIYHQLLCLGLPCVAWAGGTSAQNDSVATITAAKCFVEAPMDVLPFASRSARLDMIDYYQAGLARATNNEYGGTCRITSADDMSISLLGTSNVSYQLFVLNPGSNKQYIGVIETIPTPIPDSKLTVYDTTWNPIQSMSIDPLLSDWLNADGKKNQQVVMDAMPFIMASYSYDPATGTLTVAHHMDRYFVEDEGHEPLALLKGELTYTWNGKQFRINK